MSNRIIGSNSPDPQKNQPLTPAEKERGKRVEKVENVDPDEQARNRRKETFRMMMEEGEEPKTTSSSKAPSPVDLFSSTSSKKSFESAENSALPSPQTSPPPTVKPSASHMEVEDHEDLPHSKEFWHQVNLPDEPPPSKPRMASKEEEEFDAVPQPEKRAKRNESGAFPGQRPIDSTHQQDPGSFSKKEIPSQSEKRAPTARYWEPEHKIERSAIPLSSEKEEEEDAQTKKLGKKKGPKELLRDQEEAPTNDQRSIQPFAEPPEKTNSWEKHSKDKLDKSLPATPQLSPDLRQTAVQAVSQAQPYLTQETLPLFFQLIGSILVMVNRSGINKTEIRLVGSTFKNSKFYGSTIEIIKFSTAPDSINIHLTGTNEAVTAFNQNLSQLRAAFETGKFKFRVGRLVAEYSPARASVHRKKMDEGEE